MDAIGSLKEGVLFENALWQWLAALGTLAAAWLLALVAAALGRRRVERSTAPPSDVRLFIAEVFALQRKALWLLIAVWPAAQWLSLPEAVVAIPRGIGLVALGVQIALSLSGALAWSLDRERAEREAEGRIAEVSSFGLVRAVGMIVVWSVVAIVVLANMGIEITALVASLGVGGIAVALAAQNVLGDLLASLSIVLDRPFEVGDFIIVGTELGTVERIGLKTTHVRALSGEQLIFGNGDLLRSRIRNFKRMERRRVVLKFGVLYSSAREQLEKVPGAVREIIGGREGVRFDRAHFLGFAESALDFEVVYFILSPDYNVFMDHQQAINLEVLDRVRALGLEFAYPTRTLHIASHEDPQEIPKT